MVPSSNGKCTNEIHEIGQAETHNWTKDQTLFDSKTSYSGLLDERKQRNSFLDFIRAFPDRAKYLKLGPSPSVKFWQFADVKDEISRTVSSSAADRSPPSSFSISFVKKIDWTSLWQLSKAWIRDPMNMALFVWILCVAISGAILFMVMTGMLNAVLPSKSQRNSWFEVNNQILNALFTLMCLYQHPKRFYHLVLLIRWRPEDVLKLRKVYCKDGAYKPNEWVHMMVVVVLLNLNCFAQYALCGLNLGYPRSKRPAIGVALCISVAIGAPAFSGVYNMLSPLGRDYEPSVDQEAQILEGTSTAVSKPTQLRLKTLERKYSFAVQGRVPESNPQWVGGLYDLWDDIALAYLSVFCSCCVFGWNMEKLGFGNMYVHILTFFLFCIAPFFIFNLAAINIDNESVREALGITGILLCIFGLLYGGFWRIQMRKRFKLPGYTFCCGRPSVTDCFLWLCCCSCALSQEVRTADYYDIVEDKFFLKRTSNGDDFPVSPLRREDALPLYISSPNSLHQGLSTPTKSPSRFAPGSPSSPYRGNSSPRETMGEPLTLLRSPGSPLEMMRESSTPTRSPGRFAPGSPLPMIEEDESLKAYFDPMEPPVSPLIRREGGSMP